jgi:hypothetical protein
VFIIENIRLHPPTNEALHCDSRTGFAVEAEEGTSLTQVLYDALLQSVQVMLEGNEVGGFSTILRTFVKVSGPVMVSTLVRVSVIHSVLPLINSAGCQIEDVLDVLFKAEYLADCRINQLDLWNEGGGIR